jgi:3D (Asp-Asp-Asp) domain-containing protein
MHRKDSKDGSARPKYRVAKGLLSFWILIAGWHFTALERSGNGLATETEASLASEVAKPLPFPSSPVPFQATAYCEYGITKSGVWVAPGIAAADVTVLPLGSLIHVEGAMHRGVYRIMDTGRLIKGKIIDLYMPSLASAIKFGRQKVSVRVLQYGPAKQKSARILSPQPALFQGPQARWPAVLDH